MAGRKTVACKVVWEETAILKKKRIKNNCRQARFTSEAKDPVHVDSELG